MRALTFGAIIGAGGAIGAAPALAASNGTLLPHRAVYELDLLDSDARSVLTSAQGRLAFELTGSRCDGFIMNTRFVLDTELREGRTILNDYQSSTWENPEENAFRFISKDYVDSQLSEEIDGTAERTDGTVIIQLDKPDAKEVEIETQALFPVQHIMALLEAASTGETVFQSMLFDGTDGGEKIYSTTAIIGDRVESGVTEDDATPADEALADVPRWPIVISYFDEAAEDSEDGLPIYEMSFTLFENGVTRSLVLDYGDFRLEGVLGDFEPLDVPDCG
ncbi:MAG: cell envelope integrity EipB family protein [Pseudomonadota bacterium]